MTQSKFEKVIALATAICVTLLGIAFIACCAHLYYTGGDEPYSRERVGEYLSFLIIPAIITVGVVLTGIILNVINGQNTDTKIKLSKQYILSVKEKKIDLDTLGDEARSKVMAERKNRAKIKAIFLALSIVCYIISVVYIIFFCEYTVENLSSDVMRAFAGGLPFGLLGVVMNIPVYYLCEQSTERELLLIKTEKNKAESADACNKEVNQSNEDVIGLVAKIVIISISALLILLGILNGGMDDVLGKAIKICTECIGLG